MGRGEFRPGGCGAVFLGGGRERRKILIFSRRQVLLRESLIKKGGSAVAGCTRACPNVPAGGPIRLPVLSVKSE